MNEHSPPYKNDDFLILTKDEKLTTINDKSRYTNVKNDFGKYRIIILTG
jgi:hypothetical protein